MHTAAPALKCMLTLVAPLMYIFTNPVNAAEQLSLQYESNPEVVRITERSVVIKENSIKVSISIAGHKNNLVTLVNGSQVASYTYSNLTDVSPDQLAEFENYILFSSKTIRGLGAAPADFGFFGSRAIAPEIFDTGSFAEALSEPTGLAKNASLKMQVNASPKRK